MKNIEISSDFFLIFLSVKLFRGDTLTSWFSADIGGFGGQVSVPPCVPLIPARLDPCIRVHWTGRRDHHVQLDVSALNETVVGTLTPRSELTSPKRVHGYCGRDFDPPVPT